MSSLVLLLVLAPPGFGVPPASTPVTLLRVSLSFLVDVVIRSLTDLRTDPPVEVALGRLNDASKLGRTRLSRVLNFLADVVIRSLTDLSTDPPGEVAVGRSSAALKLGRTRLLCVPPATRTVVVLPVSLNGVAMVIPGPGWLLGCPFTPRAPAIANGPPGLAPAGKPASTMFKLPKPLNATLPPICWKMFAVGSGTFAALTPLPSPKMLVALLKTPNAEMPPLG